MQRMALGLSAAVLILAGTTFAAEEHTAAAQPQTRAEAQAAAGQLFDKLDLNHDGKLDQADRAVHSNELFDRLDTNHDGVISREEFGAAHADGMGHEHGGPDHDMADPDKGDGHPGGRHASGHRGHDRGERDGLVMLILHRADPGHTGTVTRDTFVGAALALFDQADTNHDGILTPAERQAAARAAREQMGAGMERHGGWEHDDMPPPDGN